MSSAQTEAFVQALAPHLADGGEEEARDAAESLPHALDLSCEYDDDNGIGEAGATALAPHLPHTLQSLKLYDNAIGAAGARPCQSTAAIHCNVILTTQRMTVHGPRPSRRTCPTRCSR